MCKSLFSSLILLLFFGSSAFSQHRILLDENVSDWNSIETAWTAATSSDGISLNTFKITNDEQFLFIYFKSDLTYSLQNRDGVKLYIDSDNNSSTGFGKEGIGAEIVFNFGQRRGTAYLNSAQYDIAFTDLFMVTTPTIDSDWYEVAINRNAVVNSTEVFEAGEIKLILSDESVQNGVTTSAVNYSFKEGSPGALPEYSFSKKSADHLRVIAHNVEFDSFFDNSKKPAYERLYNVIEPDIIGFSEIYNHSGTDVANRLEEMLPSPSGESWRAAKIADNFVATRYSIKNSWAAGGFGNGIFLLDLRPDYNTDALVVVAHPPCCDNDANRQAEVDAIMSFIREAKEPGGDVALNDSTPIIIMGDMNFVGSEQQVTTLLTGDISDEGTYGNDFTPDWSGASLLDAKPLVTNLPMTFTQGNQTSPGSYSKGRLDYMVYSGSVLDLQNSYVLYTNSLSVEQLNANGLVFNDTESASDHFPVVADFKVTAPASDPQASLSSMRYNNSDGSPELLGSVVTTSGTVTVAREFGSAGPAYIQNGDAGVALFGADLISGLSIGDHITITSPVGFYNGLTEFIYDPGISNVAVNNSGNSTTPLRVIIDDVLNQSWGGYEAYEGALVEIKDVAIDGAGTFAPGTNYTISDGQSSLTLRVDDSIDLSGVEITDDSYTIVGVISQYDMSPPYSEGYTINPRFAADIKKHTIASIGNIRLNNEDGVPDLLNEIVTVSGVVTVNAEFGDSGPRFIQDQTGGLGMYGTEFGNTLSTGDSITVTSVIGQYNGLTQLLYDAGSTEIEVIKSNADLLPQTVTIHDILNQAWSGLEEYEGTLVRVENASISEAGVFEGNSNYTLTDATGSIVLRVDNDTDLAGKTIPNGTLSITGIIGQFDYTAPFGQGYQLLPIRMSDLNADEEAKSIIKENLRLYYSEKDVTEAEYLAEILQEKLDYFKRYAMGGFYDNEKIFTLHYCTDQSEFDSQKPAGTEHFETSYIASGDDIYFMEPTTPEQKGFTGSLEQAAMFGLARGVIRNEYSRVPIEEWLEYGFASVHAGTAPTSDYMKQQVQRLGGMPDINALNNWENITQFDKYAFAHTAAEFIERKFLFRGIRYTLNFGSSLSFNFWSIKDEQKFNEVWSKYMELFYLGDIKLMKVQSVSDNFEVYAADRDREYAVHYSELLEETNSRFSDQLDFALQQKTKMFIYPTLCDYHNSVGIDFCNPNSIGGGVGIDQFIMVTPRDIERPTYKIEALAMHEFAHVFQFNIYPAFLPPWMSEGFASFLPGGLLTDEEIEALKPQMNQEFDSMFEATGRYPSVDDLSNRATIDRYGLGYYLLGQAMVDYIVRTHGYIPFREFVKAGGTDFTKLGYADKHEFENDWFSFYEKTYQYGTTVKNVDVRRTSSPIQINGDISERAWMMSESVEKNIIGSQNNSVTFGTLWDSNYLYVAAEVMDNNLVNDGGPTYENDGVEIYIDANFNKGTTFDAHDRLIRKTYNEQGIEEIYGHTGGILHAIKDIEGGYSIELAIPWSNLNISGTANTTIGFDIANHDDDNGGVRENMVVWNGIGDNWRNTKYYGEITLTNDLATDIETDKEGIPVKSTLDQNYPNPFNPTTTISFALSEPGKTSLIVYDLLGKNVAALVNGVKSAGSHSVQFDASRLNSGIYIYVLKTEKFSSAKKLILVK